MLTLPKVKTMAKSVQTTAEVSRKYCVLTEMSARTRYIMYAYLLVDLMCIFHYGVQCYKK